MQQAEELLAELAGMAPSFLEELGMDAQRAVTALRRRPNLLGLDPDNNMRRMVDYLQSTGKTQEEALDLLLTSL